MYKTLKRLEILKTALELDDELFVDSLLDGFEPFRDEAIGAIVEAVYAFDYLSAKEKIENYLAKYSKDVAMYEDREIPNLKIELKMVELKLQNLSEAKNEYLRELADFNVK